ncbi:hypothetical protein [Niabella hibiscisoli]|uniref:hypothetical protein n=1 Tax=Niabella hibiscisoli TaxID=1825928 RepID=UPI001F0DBF31|nr:hypothetical protein [Niabella hibiscisoli]MCH5718546.1 hypothetical protein [Niabella hibiscisoli]
MPFSDYNELSFVNLNLKNYNLAIEYSNKALQFVSDKNYKIFPLNNQALAYQKKKEYTTAISIYKKIIEWSKPNKQEYARILSNMAKTKWLENPNYPARDELLEALKIRQEEKDSWGLNASYGHLADYYTQLLPDSARYYANALKHIAEYLKSPDDELAALSKLIPLSTFEKYKEYFKQHQFLSDSLQTARSNAKNQFALIRYNAEKHKTENLTLQKENAETRLRILWWQVILIIVTILTIIGFIWYRKLKQQAIQEQRLRMSKKCMIKLPTGFIVLCRKLNTRGFLKKMYCSIN